MKNFEEFKQECIEMVLECFDENLEDCKMAQQLNECDYFTDLAQVMIDWEYWEFEDAISYARKVEEE
jgi:hypothetical protein